MKDRNVIPIEKKDELIIIRLEKEMYRLSSIYSTCFLFLETEYIHIKNSKNQFIIEITPKINIVNEEIINSLIQRFLDELIKNTYYAIQSKAAEKKKILILQRLSTHEN